MDAYSIILIALTLIYVAISLLFFIGLFIRQKGRNQIKYTVSVVIAARNEEKNVSQLLSDLIHQTYPRQLYEVIVVNDGSADKTAQIVSEFVQKQPHIHLVTLDEIPSGYSPKKFALHTGVMKSNGDIILTTDADCHVKSTWIETMVSYFSPNVSMVVGFSQLGRKKEKRNFLERLQAIDFMQLMAAAAGSCALGYPLAASGQNLGYRRVVYQQVGGYDPIAHRISGDDVLLLQLVRRLKKRRIVFAYSPQAFNISQPQKTLKGLFNQRIRWASNASYQIRLNKPFFIYLVNVFLLNAALLLGMIFAISPLDKGSVIWGCLLAKVGAELVIAAKAASVFKRPDLLMHFPAWALLQMPYVVMAGIFGAFGKFSWKERDHQAKASLNRGG